MLPVINLAVHIGGASLPLGQLAWGEFSGLMILLVAVAAVRLFPRVDPMLHAVVTCHLVAIVLGFHSGVFDHYLHTPITVYLGIVLISLWGLFPSRGWSSILRPLAVACSFALAYVIGLQWEFPAPFVFALVAAGLSGVLLSWFAANAFDYSLRSSFHLDRGLDAAIQQAENAFQAKSEFLANMSHEIRTPLHGVIGIAEILNPKSLFPHQAELLQTIRSCSKHLLSVINDILDFSKIEARKLDLECVPLDVRALLADIEMEAVELARDKPLHYRTEVDQSVGTVLLGDPCRLRQVFKNLVSNALKFTERGEVVVTISQQEPDPDHVLLTCQVQDTGPGMAPKLLSRLFQPFHQADPSSTRQFGGTGLGLAITRELVEMMHGTISTESAPEKGTITRFTLRLRTPTSRTNSIEVASPPRRKIPLGKSVLHIDDNKINRTLVDRILQNFGVACISVSSGEEGLMAAQNEKFDLILTDIQMPGMDGLEFTREIRKLQGGAAKMPIIAMSATDSPEDRGQALDAGANDFLSKPFDMEQLRMAMSRWLNRQHDGNDT